MFSPRGPSLRELAVQALSSVEGGYDLLAPKFDHTPFRTSDGLLDATAGALRPLGPFGRGLDVCCGTGAGMRVLESVCQGPIMGVDFSAGMLAQARRAHPDAGLVRADARALSFAGGFDLAVSFGALGHFLPAERPALFAGVRRALRPGGIFAIPVAAPPPVTSIWYLALAGFDLAMRVRNALWRPAFVMYYRTCSLSAIRNDLTASGFTVTTVPLAALGRRADGSPRGRLVLARAGLGEARTGFLVVIPGVPPSQGAVPHDTNAAERAVKHAHLFEIRVGPALVGRTHVLILQKTMVDKPPSEGRERRFLPGLKSGSPRREHDDGDG